MATPTECFGCSSPFLRRKGPAGIAEASSRLVTRTPIPGTPIRQTFRFGCRSRSDLFRVVNIESEEIAKVSALITAVLAQVVLDAQKQVKEKFGVTVVIEVNWRPVVPEET